MFTYKTDIKSPQRYKTSSEFTYKTDIKLYTRVLYIKNYKLNASTICIFYLLARSSQVYPYLLLFDMYMKFKDLPIKISVFSSNGNVIKKEIGIMILTIIFFLNNYK